MANLSDRGGRAMDSLHDLYNTARTANPRTRWIKKSVVDEYHLCLDVLAEELREDLQEYYVPDNLFVHRPDVTSKGTGGVTYVSVPAPWEQQDGPKNYVKAEEYWRRQRLAVQYLNRLAAREEAPAPMDPETVPARTGRPTVFIGSSTKGLDIAKAIQANLKHSAESLIWSQGAFGLSGNTLESLIKAKEKFDFAVLVLTPDDLLTKREETKNAPRDNVIFELGFFIGGLGRDRTFMVYCHDDKIDLPSDLAGITPGTFIRPEKGNWKSALGPFCTDLEEAMGLGQNS